MFHIYNFGMAWGIESQLHKHGSEIIKDNAILLQINIDGVPLFKSTTGQFWPILGKIDIPIVKQPFVIGVYYGVSKPSNLDFLSDFVSECCELKKGGVLYNNCVHTFGVSVLICDAPARAFLKNIKGHTSYSACERCSQSGIWNN